MKNQRLQQFAASFLIVLSLLVSSISAACTCSHQTLESGAHCQSPFEAKIAEHAAHSHSHETQPADAHSCHHQTISAETSSVAKSDCCCTVQPAPRAIAKAENVKIEKQQAAVLTTTEIELVLVHQTISVKTAEFVTPFYLSDSFHNLTPGRAPPGL